MPMLDVSEVVSDPELADTVNIIRRGEIVDQKGRPTDSPVQTFRDIVGVVTYQDPAELMRRDDSQEVPRSIFFATTFRLRGVSTGFHPDQIEHPQDSGVLYTIRQIYPYSRYGAGVIECVATSMRAVDPPVI